MADDLLPIPWSELGACEQLLTGQVTAGAVELGVLGVTEQMWVSRVDADNHLMLKKVLLHVSRLTAVDGPGRSH